jgi:hypothetical protein
MKYKSLYPCDYDAALAPKLSAMRGGRRLPLRGTRTSISDLADRLSRALFIVHGGEWVMQADTVHNILGLNMEGLYIPIELVCHHSLDFSLG